MPRSRVFSLCAIIISVAGCRPAASTFCYGDGLCVTPEGEKVLADGRPVCELTDDCDGGPPTDSGPDVDPDPNPGDPGSGIVVGPNCWCPVDDDDSDGDCLDDVDEDIDGDGVIAPWVNTIGAIDCFDLGDLPGETDPLNPDTDGDGIRDGCEGRLYAGLLAFHPDSDCDGLPDGIEDPNGNAVFEPRRVTCTPDGQFCAVETNPRDPDTDHDGIRDGVEDRDGDGQVDAWVDVDGDGCFDADEDTPGESDPREIDSDADGIPDPVEDDNEDGLWDTGETAAWHPDSDCDRLPDGVEDANHDGYRHTTETDPLDADSDRDGIPDGIEDRDLDGAWEPGETDPRDADTDGDNIPDGIEDANRDGFVDPFDDLDGDGCWDPGEPPGELDPRSTDSDGDGIPDPREDFGHDGGCDAEAIDGTYLFAETCGFLVDTDCDGIADGREDENQNGSYDPGELDPRRTDTDGDGLVDGCHPEHPEPGCEDLNADGLWDAGETDPRSVDTDGDDLTDGCELNFIGGPTDPTALDTDGDGASDGDEDGNHNCTFEPTVDNCDAPETCPETDPRIIDEQCADASPACTRWSVCAATNLEGLTFAASALVTQDYQLAFAVETAPTVVACASGLDCDDGEACHAGTCRREAPYLVQTIGRDLDDDGDVDDGGADDLAGHLFQTSAGVAPDPAGSGEPINRDLYGFVIAKPRSGSLAAFLDGLGAALATGGPSYLTSVERIGNLLPQPAHDALPGDLTEPSGTYPIDVGQSIFRLKLDRGIRALDLRNALVTGEPFLADRLLDDDHRPPAADPVYPGSYCPGHVQCHAQFTLYVSAVERALQPNAAGGEGVWVLTVALTPDDRCGVEGRPDCQAGELGVAERQRYDERVARLEDLTGGSALARHAAERSASCEQKDQKSAYVDLLWVVDDSASMQQMIGRVQQAARDAEAVLQANSRIIDYRVALTTTNPSRTAVSRCREDCDQSCGGPSCDQTRCDAALGCYKVCPESCAGDCSDSGGSCDPSCTSTCLTPPTIDATELEAQIALDVAGDLALPGGGGTFYYEDTYYLDCDGTQRGIDDCSGESSLAPLFAGGAASGPLGLPRRQLFANAGFLAGSESATCERVSLSLLAQAATCVGDDDPTCCERLVSACDDGATVLASQMCDLVRAMGGLPEGGTPSARPHSAPEHGSRSARRLLQTMEPALPRDYAETCAPCDYDARFHLRLPCSVADADCQPCYPSLDPTCEPVPVLTVFLSDEEDAYFKDDCASSASDADRTQLPELCTGVDGDPTTFESCDPCAGDPACDRRSYCEGNGLAWGPPAGSDPDAVARVSGSASTQRRDDDASECATTLPKPSPCDAACAAQWAAANSAAVQGIAATTCATDPCVGQPDEATCGAITIDIGSGAEAYCTWTAIGCMNRCAAYSDIGGTGVDRRCNCAGDRADPSCNSAGDPLCAWHPEALYSPTATTGACRPAYPLNDCRACKRFLRHLDALEGVAADPFTGGPLVGLESLGRVYAIVRDAGSPGAGANLPGDTADRCGGTANTWGLGDGEAYRALAEATFGRTQDVCADSYESFFSLLLDDSRTLSEPYPLTGKPIAATLKVGIARDLGGGDYAYVQVPRSRTQGFFYGAQTNSIAFKSDPVDGICSPPDAPPACGPDGDIDPEEIDYARTAPTVPQEGDIIFVSYRQWEPVPCRELCSDEEICVRVLCPESASADPCPSGEDRDCAAGHACDPGTLTCQLACLPGQPVDACRLPRCPECQERDPSSGLCEPVGSLCECQPSGAEYCTPGVPGGCRTGFTCDENCGCEPIPGCAGGFRDDGTVAGCLADRACCQAWDDAAALCRARHCSTAGTPCTVDDDCPAEESCVGVPAVDCQEPCAWVPGVGCDFPYPTCCGAFERAECDIDEEANEANLECVPSCVCAPGCDAGPPNYEVCDYDATQARCRCFATPP